MPKVRIEILAGKTTSFKKALMDSIHKALVETLKIPEHDRTIRLYELEPENFQIPGNKTGDYTHIEITLFSGRSPETKKSLYKSICKNLEEAIRIKGDDVTIILFEVPLLNWGIRGGIPASEVNLGFDVGI